MNRYYYLAILALCVGCRRAPETQQPSRPYKKIPDMEFEEAEFAKNYYKKNGNNELAIKSLERAILMCQKPEKSELLMLELADMVLADGDYEKAQKIYREFKNFYPGSESLEYALYQELVSFHLANLTSDRDQTKTHETIQLAQSFLDRFKQSEYHDSVKNTLTLAYHSLYQHELNQIEFYLNKFSYEPKHGPIIAARNRLRYVQENIMPHLVQLCAGDLVQLTQLDTSINAILASLELPNSTNRTTVIAATHPELTNHVIALSSLTKSLKSVSNTKLTQTQPRKHDRDRF